ncbi:hypothetical protein VTO73DRAFT_12864 [Trametes versicolor]
MLRGDIVTYALRKVGLAPPQDEEEDQAEEYIALEEVADVNGPRVQSHVCLSAHYAFRLRVAACAAWLGAPDLHEMLRRFLREQHFPDLDEPGDVVPLDLCPRFPMSTRLAMHYSATATFFAPSELCGPGGMHSELIRCNPSWRNEAPRCDTVLVQLSEDDGFEGMVVGRILSSLEQVAFAPVPLWNVYALVFGWGGVWFRYRDIWVLGIEFFYFLVESLAFGDSV